MQTNHPAHAVVSEPDCSPASAGRVELRLKPLRAQAALPRPHTQHSAGLDLAACPEDGRAITLDPGDIALVPCGFAMAIPSGFEGQVRPRSGLAVRHGISIPNAPGTIDSDYRGEIKVSLINLGREPFVVEPGMRIAQMVIAPVVSPVVRIVDELDETDRGEGGFGSTGV